MRTLPESDRVTESFLTPHYHILDINNEVDENTDTSIVRYAFAPLALPLPALGSFCMKTNYVQ